MIILTYGPGWGEKNEILCPTRVVCSTIPRGGRRRRLDGRACSVGDDDVVVIVIFTTTFLFRGSGRRRRVCPPHRKGVEKPTVFTPSSLFVHLATTGKTTTFPVRQTSVRPTSVRPCLYPRYLRVAAVPGRWRVYRNARCFTPMA